MKLNYSSKLYLHAVITSLNESRIRATMHAISRYTTQMTSYSFWHHQPDLYGIFALIDILILVRSNSVATLALICLPSSFSSCFIFILILLAKGNITSPSLILFI